MVRLFILACHHSSYSNASLLSQALYFKEQDIDEFRDCFYLKTQPNSGHITSVEELKTIMRSLGMSPTEDELAQYFKEKSKSFKLGL